MRNAIVVLLLCLPLIAGCRSTQTANNAVILNDVSSKITIDYMNSIPSFSIYQKPHRDSLNIFLSPTCNFCERLFLDIMDAYADGDSDFIGVKTTFTLMPRNATDVDIIGGFMCVNPEKRPQAIFRYYKAVERKIGHSPITESVAKTVYATVLELSGVSSSQRVKCQTDPRNRAIGAEMYRIGDKFRQRDSMPVIIFNGQYISMAGYSGLSRSIFRATTGQMR